MDDRYPRGGAEGVIARLYTVAHDSELPILDELLRRGGLRWEHIGCFTNTTLRSTCERCGKPRSTLEGRDEVLP